jgi:DNA-binding response OmpR family regulator
MTVQNHFTLSYRNKNILTPIIMLNYLDSVESKTEGFDCGADYYVVKPFSFLELLARINVLNCRDEKEIVLNLIRISFTYHSIQ